MLNVPELFKLVKSNDFHISLTVRDYDAMVENSDLEHYIHSQLYMMIYKDLIATMNEHEEVIVPRINKVTCTLEPHPYDPRMKVSIIVEYFQFLLRVDESVLDGLRPINSFSIRGMGTQNFNGEVGDIHTKIRTHHGKRPDMLVIHEPDMELERPNICGVDNGEPKDKPNIFGGKK